MALGPAFEEALAKLFRFGDWKDAMSGKIKLSGRRETQDPISFQVYATMGGYVTKLKVRQGQDRSPLTDSEKK